MTRTTTPTTGTTSPSPLCAPTQEEIERSLLSLRGRRVAVAMSGGVDSAVAAWMLKRAGAEVIGLSLRLHDPEPDNPLAPRACCPPDDLQDARRVAEGLDIPFYVIDARDAFDSRVVRPFVQEYLAGRTPNPCVGCNSFVKLERLAKRAQLLGCERLATGHYARIRHDDDNRPHLFVGADHEKDQSYFLFGTATEIMARLFFPIGAMTKDEVRRRAIDSGLPVAHKLESQEVCFVGGSGAGRFVLRQPEAAGDRSGTIVDSAGKVLAKHDGVAGFTIGQRRGLGIGIHTKLHVLQIDADTRTVVVGDENELGRRGLIGTRPSWVAGAPPAAAPIRALARIRYRNRGMMASITPEGENVRVLFDNVVPAVAPGQAVVFYDGAEVLGGAWIREALL